MNDPTRRPDVRLVSTVTTATVAALIAAALLFGSAPSADAQRIGQPITPPPVIPPTNLASPVLRVCSDPNNMPFSNEKQQGFENKLAALIAATMHKTVVYTWWPQRRGFVRQTLAAGRCDVIMGVPAAYELALTTQPYYRSTYVFVTRKDAKLGIRSFNDPRLRTLRIGVHAIGADYDALPPVQALTHRGIVKNVKGYTIYGDYSKPNPPADLVTAVADRAVDVAIGWGPLVSYFARKSPAPLNVVAVSPQIDMPYTPLVFDIAMGVRHNDQGLRDALNHFIDQHQADIDRLLESYGVPLLDLGSASARPASSR